MATAGRIGFIGGGRVTRILLTGWDRAGRMPAEVLVSDPADSVLEALTAGFPGIETTNDNGQAAARDIVFLAVHPPAAAGVLEEIRPVLAPSTVLVSLVPKLTRAKIASLLGGFERTVRMIPNAPSIVGAGYNPIVFGAGLGGAERAALIELFDPFGCCPQVAEETLEIYAVITAMGPTYFWYQFLLLEELARAFGLGPQQAKDGVTAMLEGAVRTLADAKLTPAEIRDLIPVKPLTALEPTVTETMRAKLTGLMAKLRV